MKSAMKMTMIVAALAMGVAGQVSGTIIWGYETWTDRGDGQVAEWGTYNLSVTPDNVSALPESLAVATIQSGDTWGVMYYGTGVSSEQIPTYRYLYIETYDIQGNMLLQIAGPADADNYNVTPFCVAGDPGNPNVIYNPGPYVFDMSGWAPASSYENVSIKLVAEGGEGAGFTVNRLFFTDDLADTGFEVIPEPSTTALMIGAGLSLFLVSKKRRKNG
ncbi:MAG: hypothetical protein BWY59_00153 [Verrucomicrobia bacterium ADurb.Bin345]|nr:MAG: hypothetical protein BWY59_00153 [Verrucomicrobia bacterium ADurb.Bin345]